MRAMGQDAIVMRLKNNFLEEANDIISKYGSPDQSVVNLIDDLKNL